MNTQELSCLVKSLLEIEKQLEENNCDPKAACRAVAVVRNKLQADVAASDAQRKRYAAQPQIDGSRKFRYAKPAENIPFFRRPKK